MKKLDIKTGFWLAVAAVAVVCYLGIVGPTLLQAGLKLVQAHGFHHAVAVLTTCVLAGIVGNLNRQLPNYAGRPPFDSLLRLLKPSAAVALLALLLGLSIALMLRNTLVLTELSRLALNASIGLNLGVIAFSIGAGWRIVSQYRKVCAWEDSIPLHQRGF